MTKKEMPEIMRHTALFVVQFIKGRETTLNTDIGESFISGLQSGLRAAGWPELADAVGDWPNMNGSELAAAINRWHGSEIVSALELLGDR